MTATNDTSNTINKARQWASELGTLASGAAATGLNRGFARQGNAARSADALPRFAELLARVAARRRAAEKMRSATFVMDA